MFMSIEKIILTDLDNNVITDEPATKSKLLSQL